MENEYREREEPKVRYEQAGGNPMDAIRGKAPKPGTDNYQPETGGKTRKQKPGADQPKAGNEYKERQQKVEAGESDKEKPKTVRSKSLVNKRPSILVQVLNGDILTRDFVLNNLTFIFFILFLLLLVVGKGYYGKQLAKDIDTLQTDVNATTAEYIENKAKLEELTTRYRLVEMLERRGLKESLKPAKVIRIKRPKK
jgi:hypothetical protein